MFSVTLPTIAHSPGLSPCPQLVSRWSPVNLGHFPNYRLGKPYYRPPFPATISAHQVSVLEPGETSRDTPQCFEVISLLSLTPSVTSLLDECSPLSAGCLGPRDSQQSCDYPTSDTNVERGHVRGRVSIYVCERAHIRRPSARLHVLAASPLGTPMTSHRRGV